MAGDHDYVVTEGGLYPRGFSAKTEWAWPLVKSSQIAKLNYGKAMRATDRIHGQIPVYGSNGQCGWHNESLRAGPGVILGRKGQGPLGVEWCDEDFWVIDTAYFATPETDELDLRYFYYLTKYIGLNHLKDGTSNPSLSRDTFADLLLPFPPIETQRAIVSIVKALDDKIELNRRMNATLESLARAIFKSWFVDFDPVRSKSGQQAEPPSGTGAATATSPPPRDLSPAYSPFTLPPSLSALFPSTFQDSDLGKIPEGWEVKKLVELTSEIGSGATPRGGAKVYVDEGVALVRSQNVFDYAFVWNGLARITDAAADKLSNVTLEEDDILFNITGASVLRTCVIDPSVLPARVNQHVARIRAHDGVSHWFLHEHLVRKEMKEYLMGFNAGATREAVTKGHLQNIKIVTPPQNVMEQFDELVGPLYRKKQKATAESLTLSTLRDTLLPKLLSGELPVPAALTATSEALASVQG